MDPVAYIDFLLFRGEFQHDFVQPRGKALDRTHDPPELLHVVGGDRRVGGMCFEVIRLAAVFPPLRNVAGAKKWFL